MWLDVDSGKRAARRRARYHRASMGSAPGIARDSDGRVMAARTRFKTMIDPTRLRPTSAARYPWYDSSWLYAYSQAIQIVRDTAPARLGAFEAAFDVLRTRPDFMAATWADCLDAATLAQVRAATASLAPHQLEMHEAGTFGRFVVHDHSFFAQLQAGLADLVGEAVGEPVEPSYNFLSLYGPQGVCPVHMDAPIAKWTVDICVSQTEPWPIHLSRVVDWPVNRAFGADWERSIKSGEWAEISTFTLAPGQALVFAGSSQWHWRDPMPATNPGPHHCDLLFFHYIPRGTRALSDPRRWADLFGIPGLAKVCEEA